MRICNARVCVCMTTNGTEDYLKAITDQPKWKVIYQRLCIVLAASAISQIYFSLTEKRVKKKTSEASCL